MLVDKRFDFRFLPKKNNWKLGNYCALVCLDHTNNKAYYMEAYQGGDDIYTNECTIDEMMEYLVEYCNINKNDFKDNLAMIEYLENWLLEKQYNEQQANAFANVEDEQMLITLKGGNN